MGRESVVPHGGEGLCHHRFSAEEALIAIVREFLRIDFGDPLPPLRQNYLLVFYTLSVIQLTFKEGGITPPLKM